MVFLVSVLPKYYNPRVQPAHVAVASKFRKYEKAIIKIGPVYDVIWGIASIYPNKTRNGF